MKTGLFIRLCMSKCFGYSPRDTEKFYKNISCVTLEIYIDIDIVVVKKRQALTIANKSNLINNRRPIQSIISFSKDRRNTLKFHFRSM